MDSTTHEPLLPDCLEKDSMMLRSKLALVEPLKNKTIHYTLTIAFGMLFLFPVLGLLLVGLEYNLTNNFQAQVFLLALLVFYYLGFTILRKFFDEISKISKILSESEFAQSAADPDAPGTNELNSIMSSFNALENRFSTTAGKLEKKSCEISILKELSELCHVTFDPDEILYITLERSLILTDSDMGSVMILDKKDRKSFIVKASIGLGEFVKIDDRIDFDTSIAKYAVINKSPVIVKDIEKDRRFGRANRPHYGSKSFVCMPVKASKEIVGVITISRKEDSGFFTAEDIEALTPLLSNAAFTYENLNLLNATQQRGQYLRTIGNIVTTINSSFRDRELLHAVLNDLKVSVPFDFATILMRDHSRSHSLTVFDIIAEEYSGFSQGDCIDVQADGAIEQAFKTETSLIVDEPASFMFRDEKEFLVGPGFSGFIIVPLKIDGSIKGVLTLSSRRGNAFRDAQSLIEWTAHGLALAIERNRLSAAVAKRDRELGTIRQIGSALASSTFDMSKVLKYTMDMIRELMNVEAGALYLLKNGELEFTVAFNTEIDSVKQFRLKLGQGIAGYVAARGESVVVNDTKKSPHFFPGVDETTGFKTRSALCVPMISQGRVIGVLQVLNKIHADFCLNDEELLQSIASSVSIAIENASLYKETVSMAEHERSVRRMFQKFVPKKVLEKILHDNEAGKPAVDELKTLTLLNIDIRGFSVLVRDIGSEKTVALLNRFFSVMGEIVFRNHGIVDKYLGDGFLAIFGAPVSNTRDADNAIVAALEMKDALHGINDFFVRELGTSIDIGISVHTGEAVVGNIGFDMKMDYTVIGDSVNTVFRLQKLTKAYPNGILISEHTCRASGNRLKLKAMETPTGDMKIFELLARKAA